MKNIHVLPTPNPSRLRINQKGKLILSTIAIGSKGETQNIYITSDEEIKEGDWVIKKYETKFPKSKANEVLQVNKINTNNGYLPNGNYYNFSNYLTVVVYDRPFQGSNDNDISRKSFNNGFKKIILTTDQDLIKDGVQAIDDEFLEWFVKNPSCERVEVRYLLKSIFDPKTNEKHPVVQHRHFDLTKMICEYKYEIIIPKEEPKQECFVTKCMHLDAEIAYKSLPKKETLEEAKKYAELSYYGNEIDAFVRGAKWQQEQDKKLYSEEEIIDLLLARDIELNSFEGIDKAKEWFEQFKKK